jgi:hypothetical protein
MQDAWESSLAPLIELEQNDDCSQINKIITHFQENQ